MSSELLRSAAFVHGQQNNASGELYQQSQCASSSLVNGTFQNEFPVFSSHYCRRQDFFVKYIKVVVSKYAVSET